MATKKRSEDDKAKILKEAKRRFTVVQARESITRDRQIEDLKFCEGDSDNLYQWPEGIRDRMEDQQRAILTINKTKQHCLDVLNDARQSRVAIKIRATGGGATYDSAMVYATVVRHIEYISNASVAYQNGLSFAVKSGIGYWRLVTDYANDDTFDQEIFIRPVKDPMTVYLGDCNEFDGSDAKYGFVFTETPRDDYEAAHPNWNGQALSSGLGETSWVREATVREAEYFRRVEISDRLFGYPDPEDPTTNKVVRESDMHPQLAKLLAKIPTTKIRKIKSNRVEWFKIGGDEILEEREWLGSYIPIIRCVGEETNIQGELDRKGHTRALKDAQRMFNYNASGSVEYGALQSKTPYTGPADAIEGFETIWETANTENPAYLPFNHRDDDGEAIPAPQRQQPPTGASVFMEGMKDAAEWMRMVSGQYQADMGAPSNERSGVAINARQRQGDNATFHFLDHQAIAIRLTGKQLLDLIPKVYDTQRILNIMSEDGTEQQLTIDPNQKEALQQQQETRDKVTSIFNPKVGKYEVEADVGPAFATQRQEAFEAYTQILAQNKDLTSIIGDIALRFADFPGAEEAAVRLKRMVPQQALEDGPAPDMVKAQQQIASLQHLVQTLAQKLAEKAGEQAVKGEKNAIEAYRAQSDRLTALKDHLATSPELLVELVRQVLEEAEATSQLGMMPPPGPKPGEGGAEPAPATPPGPPDGSGPMSGGAEPPGPPNASAADMGAGPAAAPGEAPV